MSLTLKLNHYGHAKNRESFDNAYGSDWKLSESTYRVCDWRKANAVHKWFVDHVQGGNDDCGRYSVSVDNLKMLRDDCQNAMDCFDEGNIEDAAEFMPTTQGFFFGSTDYDEYYREDLQRTWKACNNLIKTIEGRPNDWLEAEYVSSW